MDHILTKQFREKTQLNLATKQILGKQADKLEHWVVLYFKIHVMGAPIKTQQAKQRDLERFLQFFNRELEHQYLDGWTPAVTKSFQNELAATISTITMLPYRVTTINRIMASIRHFSGWLMKERPLLAGNPLAGVRDLQSDEPDWNGLTNTQVLRLKAAVEQRIKACTKANQNPWLEAAAFYLLLQTGLRESELVALNLGQYHHKGLHQVLRTKNKRVSQKIPVPQEARAALEQYLSKRSNLGNDEPLLLSRYGRRLKAQDVFRICKRIARQSAIFLEFGQQFRFTPHMLRHTFLKKVTDRHGVHFAQQLSGNVSIREIFRYAKPSQAEIAQSVENLFE